MKPLAVLRVALRPVQRAVPLPAVLGEARTFQITRQARARGYLNRMVQYFPEQLGTPKWRDCGRIAGLHRLQEARRSNRPVVLAFCHFGPYFLLRFWLRAAGIPAATLVAGTAQSRATHKRMIDRVSPFPEIPTALYQDQLREVIDFLAAGHPLLVALDGKAGRQMTVAAGDGWNFEMATGPLRLAARSRAELIPCCIIDEGSWRFRIELGRPVPEELLAAETSWALAGKHLLDEMLPHFRAHPQQSSRRLIERFQPIIPAGRPESSHDCRTAPNLAAR